MIQWSQGAAAAARRCTVLFVSTAVTLAVGCGDSQTFTTDPGDIDPSSIPEGHECFIGASIQLSRYSSSCDRTSPALSSEVLDGVVFTAEQVSTLASPCDDGPSPGFEIAFDEMSHTVAFDFSQVSRAGRFPAADFDGYMLDVTIGEDNGTLLQVSVDREVTTLDVDSDDLDWDLDHIEVNLEGVAYDDGSLLKLQLVFARVPPVQG